MEHGPIWVIEEPAHPYPPTGAPLDPQQPTPEQVADAARLALADVAIVLRIWPYGSLEPLTHLKALAALLTAP